MSLRKRILAIFTYSKKVPVFMADATAFKIKVTTAPGNTYVTIAAGIITSFLTDMADLSTAEGNAAARTEGAAAIRDLALMKVIGDVRLMQSEVQLAADSAPDEATAIAIIEACGLKVRKVSFRVKPNFEVRNDKTTSGLFTLISKAAPRNVKASYEWQWSTNGVSFTTISITAGKCRTKWASSIAPGTKIYFRKRVMTNKDTAMPSWSQIFILYTT